MTRHRLRKFALAVTVVAGPLAVAPMLVAAQPAAAETACTVRKAPPADTRAVVKQAFAGINQERSSLGLPALKWHAGVAAYAQSHSAEMAAAGSVWHDEAALASA